MLLHARQFRTPKDTLMLQIISGKFFKSQDRHVHQAKGILYSNYAWIQPIATCIGVLEPVDSLRATSAYVFNYTNQIEREGDRAGELVRTGDTEIVRQFQLLCSFGFRAYFSDDRAAVLANCRRLPVSASDTLVPSLFAPRIFDAQIMGNTAETAQFVRLVEQVIGLPRAYYCAVMSVLDNLEHALQALNWNIDLAYSMLVYCLESLSQTFDSYTPAWTDYDVEVREDIDELLAGLDPALGENFRATLLRSSHQKLSARLVDFVESHVSESYFTTEAVGRSSPLRRSHLRRALIKAYTLRSGYVHRLQPLREQLRHAHVSAGDVFLWDKEPYLTFRGLLRLVLHTVNAFIFKQAPVLSEDLNWRRELPGRMTLNLAPEYWIWQHDRLDALQGKALSEDVRLKLGGFLDHLMEVARTQGAITDMRGLLRKYERLMPQVPKLDRIRMLVLYVLYNSVINPSAQMPDWENVAFEKHKKDTETCCIETLLAGLLLSERIDEKFEDCKLVYEEYSSRGRFTKKAIEVPSLLELKLQAELANMALHEGDLDDFNRYVSMAIGDSAGSQQAQDVLLACRSSATPIEHAVFFTLHGPAAPPEPVVQSALTAAPGGPTQPERASSPTAQPASSADPEPVAHSASVVQPEPDPPARLEPAPPVLESDQAPPSVSQPESFLLSEASKPSSTV